MRRFEKLKEVAIEYLRACNVEDEALFGEDLISEVEQTEDYSDLAYIFEEDWLEEDFKEILHIYFL